MALEVRLMASFCSAPAPVHPQPLLGMFAHPSFDHGRDRLHCALEVDLPVSVARWLDGFGAIHAQAMVVGQAGAAGASNRAPGLAREAGAGPTGLHRPARRWARRTPFGISR